MALYLVITKAGVVRVVKSRDGNVAREFVGDADAEVSRLLDDGPDGVICSVDLPAVDTADREVKAVEEDGPAEHEITQLSDKVRRFEDKETGEIRSEPFD